MATPPMPLPMTPEQLAMVSQWMPPEEAMVMAAILGPKSLQYQLDHIQDDRRAETVVSVTIVAVLAVLAVALRLVCRRQMKVSMSYDDYSIIAGLVRPIMKTCGEEKQHADLAQVFTLGLCFCQAYSMSFPPRVMGPWKNTHLVPNADKSNHTC